MTASSRLPPRRFWPLGLRSRSRPAPARIGAVAVALLAAVGWIGCAPRVPKVPGWDDPDPSRLRVEPDERALWDESVADLDALSQKGLVLGDEALSTYLQGIVARLSPTTSENAPKMRVVVIKSTAGNAMASGDGTIWFDLPLLASFPDEAQAAFVLAHEIAHVLRRHTLISARYDASTPSHVRRMELSRTLEDEADRVAVDLLHTAGYDARVAPGALLHIQYVSEKGARPVHAWSSHGPIRQRVATVRRAVDALRATGGERRYEEFQRALDTLRLEAAKLELEADRFEAALALVRLHLRREPRSARAHLLRARITVEKDPSKRRSEAVGADLRAAVEYAPKDPESLRALGLHLRDTGDREGSNAILRRYLAADPEAFDRKLIERYLDSPAP